MSVLIATEVVTAASAPSSGLWCSGEHASASVRPEPIAQRRALAPELVVVGGSRGAMEALTDLLGELPATFGMAMVIVLHQHRNAPGILPAVLAARASLPVRAIADGNAVEPGTAYVCPANYHALIEPDRTFSLSVDSPVRFARPSIDVLFDSAAHVYGASLVGVLLSGSGRDGVDGLRTIAAKGGLTACQDPDSAVDPALPGAACLTVPVDRIAPPAELGAWLMRLMQ